MLTTDHSVHSDQYQHIMMAYWVILAIKGASGDVLNCLQDQTMVYLDRGWIDLVFYFFKAQLLIIVLL